jgi:hypothetical protein
MLPVSGILSEASKSNSVLAYPLFLARRILAIGAADGRTTTVFSTIASLFSVSFTVARTMYVPGSV